MKIADLTEEGFIIERHTIQRISRTAAVRQSIMIAKAALAAFLVFLGFLVYSADQGRWPEALAFYKEIPLGDKVGHFFLMGTLAFLATWASKAKTFQSANSAFHRCSLGFAGGPPRRDFQIFIPGRTFFPFGTSLTDLLGITAFGWLAARFHPKRESKLAATPDLKTS